MDHHRIEKSASMYISSLDIFDLFKKCFESLSHLKIKYQGLDQNQKLISDSENTLRSLKTKFQNHKVSLVVVGSSCSGKTTLINALLNTLLSNKTNVEKWMDILPSKEIENTSSYSFMSSIPDSKDFEKNSIYVQVEDEQPQKVSDKKELKEQIQDLKAYFVKLETKNEEIFFNVKVKKKENVNLPKIHIYFPDFNNSLKIIDTPGISTQSFQDELSKIVENEVCLFLYIKNLDNAQVNNEDVMEFFKVSRKFYQNGNYQFWMVFTKEDQLTSMYQPKEDDDSDDISKKTMAKKANFETFLELTEKEIVENHLKINKIYVISTLAAFRPKSKFCKKTQDAISKLLTDIMIFKEEHGDYFVKLIYLDRLKYILEVLDRNLKKETIVNSEVIEEIKADMEFMQGFFTNKIRELLKKDDFQNLEIFKKTNVESYKSCVTLIERCKKKLRKETYIAQGKYEKRIIELVSPDVHKLILEKYLKEIFSESFSLFESMLLKLIKPPSLLNFLLGLDSEMLTQEATNLTKLLTETIYNPKNNISDMGFKELSFTELTTNLFTPGYREIFYAYYLVKFLGVDKYILINPHNLQVDTILSWFLVNISEKSETISEYIGEQFELFLEKIVKKLENAKEMNEEIVEIVVLINKITTSSLLKNQDYNIEESDTIYSKIDEVITFSDPDLLKYLQGYISQINSE